eukprot:g1096.t1
MVFKFLFHHSIRRTGPYVIHRNTACQVKNRFLSSTRLLRKSPPILGEIDADFTSSLKLLAVVAVLGTPTAYMCWRYDTDDAFAQEMEMLSPATFNFLRKFMGGIRAPTFSTNLPFTKKQPPLDACLRAELGELFLMIDNKQDKGVTLTACAEIFSEMGYALDVSGSFSLSTLLKEARKEVALQMKAVKALESGKSLKELLFADTNENETDFNVFDNRELSDTTELSIDEFLVLFRFVAQANNETDDDVRKRIRSSELLLRLLPSKEEIESKVYAKAYREALNRQAAEFSEEASNLSQSEKNEKMLTANEALEMSRTVSEYMSDENLEDLEIVKHELKTTRASQKRILDGKTEDALSEYEIGQLQKVPHNLVSVAYSQCLRSSHFADCGARAIVLKNSIENRFCFNCCATELADSTTTTIRVLTLIRDLGRCLSAIRSETAPNINKITASTRLGAALCQVLGSNDKEIEETTLSVLEKYFFTANFAALLPCTVTAASAQELGKADIYLDVLRRVCIKSSVVASELLHFTSFLCDSVQNFLSVNVSSNNGLMNFSQHITYNARLSMIQLMLCLSQKSQKGCNFYRKIFLADPFLFLRALACCSDFFCGKNRNANEISRVQIAKTAVVLLDLLHCFVCQRGQEAIFSILKTVSERFDEFSNRGERVGGKNFYIVPSLKAFTLGNHDDALYASMQLVCGIIEKNMDIGHLFVVDLLKKDYAEYLFESFRGLLKSANNLETGNKDAKVQVKLLETLCLLTAAPNFSFYKRAYTLIGASIVLECLEISTEKNMCEMQFKCINFLCCFVEGAPLSNAFDIRRALGGEKCLRIIETIMIEETNVREILPSSSSIEVFTQNNCKHIKYTNEGKYNKKNKKLKSLQLIIGYIKCLLDRESGNYQTVYSGSGDNDKLLNTLESLLRQLAFLLPPTENEIFFEYCNTLCQANIEFVKLANILNRREKQNQQNYSENQAIFHSLDLLDRFLCPAYLVHEEISSVFIDLVLLVTCGIDDNNETKEVCVCFCSKLVDVGFLTLLIEYLKQVLNENESIPTEKANPLKQRHIGTKSNLNTIQLFTRLCESTNIFVSKESNDLNGNDIKHITGTDTPHLIAALHDKRSSPTIIAVVLGLLSRQLKLNEIKIQEIQKDVCNFVVNGNISILSSYSLWHLLTIYVRFEKEGQYSKETNQSLVRAFSNFNICSLLLYHKKTNNIQFNMIVKSLVQLSSRTHSQLLQSTIEMLLPKNNVGGKDEAFLFEILDNCLIDCTMIEISEILFKASAHLSRVLFESKFDAVPPVIVRIINVLQRIICALPKCSVNNHFEQRQLENTIKNARLKVIGIVTSQVRRSSHQNAETEIKSTRNAEIVISCFQYFTKEMKTDKTFDITYSDWSEIFIIATEYLSIESEKCGSAGIFTCLELLVELQLWKNMQKKAIPVHKEIDVSIFQKILLKPQRSPCIKEIASQLIALYCRSSPAHLGLCDEENALANFRILQCSLLQLVIDSNSMIRVASIDALQTLIDAARSFQNPNIYEIIQFQPWLCFVAETLDIKFETKKSNCFE